MNENPKEVKFRAGVVAEYIDHMLKLHGNHPYIHQFINQQIRLVMQGVRDSRLGDDTIILLVGIIR